MKAFTILFTALIFSGLLIPFSATGKTTDKEPHNMNKNNKKTETATLAGGCFWCVEADMEKIPGVYSVISGFSGGEKINPAYKDVAYGKTTHLESVNVKFNPDETDYKEIIETFFRHIDPTDNGGQFVDRGHQYTTAIFYHSEKQKNIAEKVISDLQHSKKFKNDIVTEIRKFKAFYPAEEYHQDYYLKNPTHYKRYRNGSGRDDFIKKIWGTKSNKHSAIYKKPDLNILKSKLTPLQYKVTQENGTEPPFKNEYWDNKKDGIYVDIVSGEPLFSSTDKFKSGTGWPSFTRPILENNIIKKTDTTFFMVRTEVRSKEGDSHLGHLFDDGPQPTGLRYCINSASLRFIPKESLKKEGYEKFLYLFK